MVTIGLASGDCVKESAAAKATESMCVWLFFLSAHLSASAMHGRMIAANGRKRTFVRKERTRAQMGSKRSRFVQ